MKKTSEPIVFFGSGPVAAESLRLLAQDFNIEAVVTKPRPPHHRGDVPVLSAAEDLKLPVKTAAGKKDLDKLFDDNPFKSRLGVLIDFGIIVSQKVIGYFPLGIINSHFSLLPKLRGADPITFAILRGDSRTGVSLMLLVEAMDEGPLLADTPYDIPPFITAPELTEQLIQISHETLRTIVPIYLAGEAQPKPQPSHGATYTRRLTKDDGILDFNKPAAQLEREIRAFIEWPKSRASFGGLDVIVTKSHVADISGPAGKRLIVDKLPVVYCKKQALVLDKLKPAGKKEMTGEAFLAGHKNIFLG